MLLDVDNLHVAYGPIQALHGVSLGIDTGEIVTLIGANGAGKTTLLRAISGLLRPSSGQIRLSRGDQPVRLDLTPAHEIVRHGVSHVPEGRQVFPDLSVKENLLLGAYQRHDRAEIAEGLDRCFSLFPILNTRKSQRAGTLSGGEQQMLAIGRALMARPSVLLLDEPSLGLAPIIVRKIFEIIQTINSQGATVFLVEQNANMALAIAHRGYVLQTGKVILAEKAADLLANEEVKKAYLGG